ncbi:CatB-related O-acetyltransferase [Flavobacterium sp. WC2416]|uniref:CatB-related O-acetyltransferase n=1 Tax=Flavobacterium sp. WC2416 TaxID=3234141 RepID=A0AB39WH70_9FLAO
MLQGKIYWNIDLGKFNTIDKGAKIYGPFHIEHVRIGNGTYIAPNATISHTEIGKFCSIGPNFFCGWGIHPLNGISTSPIFYSTKKQAGYTFSKTDKIKERIPIEIGNDVFIGANVTILDGIKIGDGAVIGAGSVVSKDIPPFAIAVGSPIKIIKYRFDDKIIKSLLEIKWWENETVIQDVESYFYNIEGFINKYNKK